jgi:hypothetical protein
MEHLQIISALHGDGLELLLHLCCGPLVMYATHHPKCIVVYMHVYLYTYMLAADHHIVLAICRACRTCSYRRALLRLSYPAERDGRGKVQRATPPAGARDMSMRSGLGVMDAPGRAASSKGGAVADVRLLRSIGKNAVAAGPHHRRPS